MESAAYLKYVDLPYPTPFSNPFYNKSDMFTNRELPSRFSTCWNFDIAGTILMDLELYCMFLTSESVIVNFEMEKAQYKQEQFC